LRLHRIGSSGRYAARAAESSWSAEDRPAAAADGHPLDNLPLPGVAQRGGVARLELLRDRCLLNVMFYSGMRRAEVASLTREDVQDGWAHEALITGKGSRERHVYFGEDAQRAIRAYLEARSDDLVPLFLRHDNRRGEAGPGGEHWRLSLQSIWCLVKSYAAELGINATTHHFRHLKASTLLNRGASLSEVQDVLGHAAPATTKLIYAHATPKFLRATVARPRSRSTALHRPSWSPSSRPSRCGAAVPLHKPNECSTGITPRPVPYMALGSQHQ
jgi:integrase